MMQNTDLTEAVLAVFEPISKEVNLVTTNRAIVSADAAEIEEMRRTLDRLAHSVRSVDEGAAAFSNCLIASYESGSPDSFCPGSTPFGPVEEQKRKTSASTSQVNRAPAISKKKRENYPHETTEGLKKWLFDHLHDPYPSDAERDELGARFGLNKTQVHNWFVNARRRNVKQIAAQLEQAEKAKIVAAGGVLPSSGASNTTNTSNSLPYTKRRGGVRRANAAAEASDDDEDEDDNLDLLDDDDDDEI